MAHAISSGDPNHRIRVEGRADLSHSVAAEKAVLLTARAVCALDTAHEQHRHTQSHEDG